MLPEGTTNQAFSMGKSKRNDVLSSERRQQPCLGGTKENSPKKINQKRPRKQSGNPRQRVEIHFKVLSRSNRGQRILSFHMERLHLHFGSRLLTEAHVMSLTA